MNVRLMYRHLMWLSALCCACVISCPTAIGQEGGGDTSQAEDVQAEDDASADEDASHDDTHADEDHADEEHAVHLENDPTHGNISDKTWELLDFRSDMAFFSAVVFLLLLAGLWAAAWKPIMEGLEKREDTIADNMANAERAAAEAQSKLAEYEQQLATANEEAANIVADARKDAEATGQKLVAAAQEEAARLKERATSDIDSARRVALTELADQSTEIAMAVAQRVVGREVKAEDHQGLIQELLQKLPSNN